MLLLIPLLPFLGFLLNAGFGRRFGKPVSGGIACAAMGGSFAASLAAVWRLVALEPEARVISQPIYAWITSGDLNIPFALRLDPLAAVMILVVSGIGSLIHVYSTAYMHEETDGEFARYFSYLNLFAAFMLVLVLGSTFLVMFVGWEGVGLCSYLLIGFWFGKKSATDAGKKAFIVNRIGDVGFLLGMLFIFTRFGTLDFQDLARLAGSLAPEASFGTLSIITLLLFVGATGKSAQIPLFVWLPDAMEGPTPVSALIHAATMVTAGVYMIGRNAVLFSHAPLTLEIVAGVGIATALMAGTIGLVQNDIKRVLAYSTVSQLGYMFLAMGVGAYAAGIFHLYTHAFFKALLFLGSGAVIHALGGEQDLRRMGGLRRALPITYWTFLIGALAIAGVPGFAGFFSKDHVLYMTYISGHTVLWAIGLLTALLTAVYMFRVVFLAFHGPSRSTGASDPSGHHGHDAQLHDAPPAMAVALIVLAVGSIVAGYFGTSFERFLEPSFGTPVAELEAEAHEIELRLMAVSTIVAVAGIGLAVFLFLKRRDVADRLAEQYGGPRRLLEHKYYVDEIYDAAVVQPIRIVSEQGLWKIVDVKVIDGTVNGVATAVQGAAGLLRRLQTGSVRAYAASLLLGVVVVMGYYLWR
ncbi:MAG TPA: NADH-quinone oxidoreductase subunit L [Vicinamibacterales bacterium]|nr:NADH-quinone oxidoreductase subunit L [Vicinamibacterales bacterium]